MYAKHKLYGAFKKDLNTLISQVGESRWLSELASNVSVNFPNYDAQRRIVDRIDESLGDNASWRNIRTAYGFRGTHWS